MPQPISRIVPALAASLFLFCTLAPACPATAQDRPCPVDLTKAGAMKDIVSNALTLGLHVPESDVATFLVGAEKRHANGADLLKSAAQRFNVRGDVLADEVEKFKHCNCTHAGGGLAQDRAPEAPERPPHSSAFSHPVDDTQPVSAFAKDVTLHVVLHELGHALVREFDIPVLANEETTADAFATYYLTVYMPDRALDVLTARVSSLMIEANEESRLGTGVKWGGEYDYDARRAKQIAALAVAADPVKYKPIADLVGMSETDIKKARDYGSEIHRSWRRVLSPLWMPQAALSTEVRVVYDESDAFLTRLCADGLAVELAAAAKRFDWHSQVTIKFVEGDGGAGWNRSGRTITVNSAYVRRFIDQGERAGRDRRDGPSLESP